MIPLGLHIVSTFQTSKMIVHVNRKKNYSYYCFDDSLLSERVKKYALMLNDSRNVECSRIMTKYRVSNFLCYTPAILYRYLFSDAKNSQLRKCTASISENTSDSF